MYKIALCDDQAEELFKVEALLDLYRQAHPHIDFVVNRFTSMEALQVEIELHPDFDLLLLDICLPDKSGIEAARELRKSGFTYPIVFLTFSKEFALDAFSVNAIQYLIKPVERQDFFAALNLVFDFVSEKKRRYLTIKTDGEARRIAFRDILFIETQSNYQHIHLRGREILKVRMTSVEMFEALSAASDFVRCGASFIVNLAYVTSITVKDMLIDSGEKVPIPRGAYAALKEQYFNYYCER